MGMSNEDYSDKRTEKDLLREIADSLKSLKEKQSPKQHHQLDKVSGGSNRRGQLGTPMPPNFLNSNYFEWIEPKF